MEVVWFLLKELKAVVMSVAPLLVILAALKLALRSPFVSGLQYIVGAVFTILGLFLFLRGAQMSLIPAAADLGSVLARHNRLFIVGIAFVIGFVATLVEPALATVTKEAETISVGSITQRYLTMVTACGFAVGMTLGITKVIYNVSFMSFIIPALAILVVLGYFCDQTFAAIAFDCAGATTGPVNIPVNTAIAIGLAETIDGVDPLTAGFGIIGLTVMGVAIAIMLVGVLRTI